MSSGTSPQTQAGRWPRPDPSEFGPVLHGGGGRRRRRGPIVWRVLGGLLALIGAVTVFGGALLALTSGEVPAGTTLAGEPLGGLEEAAVAEEVAEIVARAEEATLRVQVDAAPAGGAPEPVTLPLTDAGVSIDRDATLVAVRETLPGAIDRLRGLVGQVTGDARAAELGLEVEVNAEARDDIAATTAADLSRDPADATAELVPDGTVASEPGRDGVAVEAADVAAAIDAAAAELAARGVPAEGDDPIAEVTIPAEVLPAVIAAADVATLQARYGALTSASIVLRDPEGGATLAQVAGRELLSSATVLRDPALPPGERLALQLDTLRLRDLLSDDVGDVAGAPVDARVVVNPVALSPPSREQPLDTARWGGTATVEPGTSGREVAWDQLGNAIVARLAAASGPLVELDLPFEVVEPDLTTEEATALGITQPVASFTTFHACCESRVTNIHRIADIVDGHLIEPGERFELNHFVGDRTVENGFVEGGAILDGEFITDTGGGVSQFATTFFNANWFTGTSIISHQPHSIYISRYPPGREATINYPQVNLEIENDTPYGIVVDTSYTDTSITVTFWSTPYWQVETVTGDQRPNDHGSFTIFVARERTAPDGNFIRDEYTTVYRTEQAN